MSSYPRLLTIALAVACLLSLPATASAASISVTGGTLNVTAAPGEANRLTLTPGVATVDVLDPAAPLTPGAGCESTGSGRVTCAVSPLIRATVDLGDLDDTLAVTGLLRVTVSDGAGNDTVTGGGGDDTFLSSPGADRYAGGAGSDRVDYSARTAGVSVDIDDVADDAGEGDNVRRDVERVTGGSGDDTLTGSAAADRLDGGPGDDALLGGSGNDRLDGGPGDDALSGQSGTDAADYAARTEPLLIDLAAGRGGAAGEHDTYSGIEDATAGQGA